MPIIHSDGSTAGTLDEQGNLTLAGDYAWAVYPPAVAGLISILATGFLLTYIICARRTKLSNTGTVLVINILIADFIQALGWTLSFTWARSDKVYLGPTCTAQGLFIQMGDVSAALWAFCLAVLTYAIIVKGRPASMSGKALIILNSSVWALGILLSTLGFAVARATKQGPFYSIAGSWCWIATPYNSYRFAFHYGPMLFVALVLIILYSTIIWNLASRGVSIFGSFSRKASTASGFDPAVPDLNTSVWDQQGDAEMNASSVSDPHHIGNTNSVGDISEKEDPERSEATALPHPAGDRSTFPKMGVTPPRISGRKASSSKSVRGILSKGHTSKVDNAARKLFFYPIVYLVLILPLAIYRCTAAANEVLPFSGLVVCATIFSLAGTVNTILYGVTRGLFVKGGNESSRARESTSSMTTSGTKSFSDPSRPTTFAEALKEEDVTESETVPSSTTSLPVSGSGNGFGRRESRVSFLIHGEK